MSAETSRFPLTVSLRRLFPTASFVGCGDIHVSEATERSGDCRTGILFAAIRGTQTDGTQFVPEAIERGAAAILVHRPLAGISVPQCVVSDPRRTFGQLCHELFGRPSHRLNVAGVTGTNGKTTVTWLIRSILQSASRQTGVLGTIEYHDGLKRERSALTTPDSESLSLWLAAMLRRNTSHAAIELSSHALDQGRAAGLQLEVAVVTNVTQDHFDYHVNYEDYLAAKARIFEQCRSSAVAVLNADDPGCRSLINQLDGQRKVVTFGIENDADVTATLLDESLDGSRFVLKIDGCVIETHTPLVGRHNVSNCLAAAAAVHHFGIPAEQIATGIGMLAAIPGRLERVDCGQAFNVFVDYAHTDDALERSITCLKNLTHGRVICVFGAGGDRDRSKRALLAKAASLSNVPVVTSDNPRTEKPEDIVQDILNGFGSDHANPHVEIERGEAIRWALNQARSEDTVLIAGKGHETEQIVGTQRFPFDDREVVRDFLNLNTAENSKTAEPDILPKKQPA